MADVSPTRAGDYFGDDCPCSWELKGQGSCQETSMSRAWRAPSPSARYRALATMALLGHLDEVSQPNLATEDTL